MRAREDGVQQEEDGRDADARDDEGPRALLLVGHSARLGDCWGRANGRLVQAALVLQASMGPTATACVWRLRSSALSTSIPHTPIPARIVSPQPTSVRRHRSRFLRGSSPSDTSSDSSAASSSREHASSRRFSSTIASNRARSAARSSRYGSGIDSATFLPPDHSGPRSGFIPAQGRERLRRVSLDWGAGGRRAARATAKGWMSFIPVPVVASSPLRAADRTENSHTYNPVIVRSGQESRRTGRLCDRRGQDDLHFPLVSRIDARGRPLEHQPALGRHSAISVQGGGPAS